MERSEFSCSDSPSPAEHPSNLCPTHFRPAKYAELSSSPMNACERIPLRAHGWCSVSLATMRYTGIPPPSSAAMPRGQKKAPGSRGPGAQGGGDLLSRPSRAVPSARAGLTALFGMGRGGAPPRWPPCQRLGTAAGASRQAEGRGGGRRGGRAARPPAGPGPAPRAAAAPQAPAPRPAGSPRAISTGRPRRRRRSTSGLSTWSSPTALTGGLISGGASRLDAFSAYPARARLPGGGPGGPAGAPAARPARSSRTSASAPQASHARSR